MMMDTELLDTELWLLVSFSIHHFQQHTNITIAHLKTKSKENPDYMPALPLTTCFSGNASSSLSHLLQPLPFYLKDSTTTAFQSHQGFPDRCISWHFSVHILVHFLRSSQHILPSEPHLLQLTFRMPRGEFSALFSALYNLYCLKFKGWQLLN